MFGGSPLDAVQMVARFFQDGGPFMYPIALVFAVGLIITLERYWFVQRVGSANRRAFSELLPLVRDGNLKQALVVAQQRGCEIGEILRHGLDQLPRARRRGDLESVMGEQLIEVLPAIERRTPYLAVFANIATLLGLLGTIVGLIAAFAAVAGADAASKATLLSASISIAMNTTAFGLMAAIPLLLAHSHLQSRAQALTELLRVSTVKFVNHLERRNQWQQQAMATGSFNAASTGVARDPNSSTLSALERTAKIEQQASINADKTLARGAPVQPTRPVKRPPAVDSLRA